MRRAVGGLRRARGLLPRDDFLRSANGVGSDDDYYGTAGDNNRG